MNVTHAHTALIHGIEGQPARVLASYAPGDGHTVSSATRYLREGFLRFQAALHAASVTLPEGRYLLELDGPTSPGAHRHLDLPATVALGAAAGVLNASRLDTCALAGELSLDGTLRTITGSIMIAEAARQAGAIGIVVPATNGREAAAAGHLDVRAAESLSEVIAFLAGRGSLPRATTDGDASGEYSGPDFSDVKGQEHVKRALEVAVAGGHHLMMVGPPGAGKTMLAQRIPGILPPLSREDALEVTRVHSVAGIHRTGGLPWAPPFRNPQTTIAAATLVGDGKGSPGEVSLAHLGILFLDELPEFRPATVEALRGPLEESCVTLGRAGEQVTFPTDFMLVATMNPCPCGHHGDTQRRCTCTPAAIQRFLARVRVPLVDRIDIHVEVPAVRYRDLSDRRKGEPSAAIRERVLRARAVQHARFEHSPVRLNARMGPGEIREHCAIGAGAEALLRTAITRLGLSARAYHRVLKLARTIADLDGGGEITTAHVAEAIQYRSLDRDQVTVSP